jgi:hypothetical protein
MVKTHHDGEEKHLFPVLQARLGAEVMADALHEHEAFHDGFERFAAYLDSLQGQEDKFDGQVLIQIMDEFADAIVRHLHNEIPALLDLEKLGNVEAISQIWDQSVEAGIKGVKLADFFDVVPIMAVTHDVTYEDGLHKNFPPMPSVMKFVIFRIFSMWHWRFWKFGACETSGLPKSTPLS